MTGKVGPPEAAITHGLPRLNDEDQDDHDATGFVATVAEQAPSAANVQGTKPFLIVLRGKNVGQLYSIGGEVVIGRAAEASLRIDEQGVSRAHARIVQVGDDICKTSFSS